MADMAGYGFTYDPGSLDPQGSQENMVPNELFAWQICLAHMDEGVLEDADNSPAFAINRDRIVQALGLGMANGQNAMPLEDQMFVVAISIQQDGQIRLIEQTHPSYQDVSLVVAERLLRGDDHGMVALLPNGTLVPFTPPTDPEDL